MADNDAARVQIDYESGEKVYLQIARIIRDRIISGGLPVGAQIPSGNQMKQEWGVNRLTGAMAVEELRKAGLVVTRPGVGTFVAATPTLQVVVMRPGDRVVSRMPTEEERLRLGTGYLTPVLVVTRSDGCVEQYNAAVTVCQSQRLRNAVNPVRTGSGWLIRYLSGYTGSALTGHELTALAAPPAAPACPACDRSARQRLVG